VSPSRTGNPRSPRLLAPVLLVALLAGAGAVRAEPDRLPVGDRSLRPAALALAQEQAVERLVAFRRPVFCGAGRLPDVALTFDDGPSPYTLPLLQLLRRARASATFFLVGDRLADWPDLASREARLGAVGDHTWSHPRLPSLRYDAAAWEITAGRRAIAAASRREVLLFRPPYGLTTPRLDRLVGRSRMLDVRWSVDSGDGLSGATVKSVVRTVESGVQPGSIVLLHDIHPWTLAAVRRLLPWLARRGLRLVSVPELLRLDPPTTQRLRDDDGQRCGARVTTHGR
jgi:peptidoglycan/xylan/chitin deacetylase (PgdA/CDA1 family)